MPNEWARGSQSETSREPPTGHAIGPSRRSTAAVLATQFRRWARHADCSLLLA